MQWGRLGFRDTWRRTPTSILQRLLHAWRPTPAWFGIWDPTDGASQPVSRRCWRLDDSMDEEEVAAALSGFSDEAAGSSGSEVPLSIQAAAAIEAAAAAGFPAAADSVTVTAAATQRQQKAAQPDSAAANAAGAVAAAEAEQDPLVTEVLEAAQQRRSARLTADTETSSSSLQDQGSAHSSQIRQLGGAAEDAAAVQPPEETAAAQPPESCGNGSQPDPQHAPSNALEARSRQPVNGRAQNGIASGSGGRRSREAVSSTGSIDDCNTSRMVHRMQLQPARQHWPAHPGAAACESACCVASHEQQRQLLGRMRH